MGEPRREAAIDDESCHFRHGECFEQAARDRRQEELLPLRPALQATGQGDILKQKTSAA